ncbi:MAG: chemotaxis protein CheA [Flammeovirgaceae bacterium]
MKDDELKAIFLAEALSSYEELNRLFTQLEKNNRDQSAIEAIFRITHTLKANAAAMGYDAISEISHMLEDIFSIMKSQQMELTDRVFNDLFRANDKLGDLIEAIKSEKKVPYKGLTTKLRVILRNLTEQTTQPETEPPALLQKVDEPEAHKETKETQPNAAELAFSDFVQVPIEKLDQLLNLVSELAIERDRLLTANLLQDKTNTKHLPTTDYSSLYRITSDLQYAVMSVRLVKVHVLFNKFHRIVRDVASFEKKKVDLVLEGTDIEIDRNVLQTISESLIHLVRNGISHGLEQEEERKQQQKSPAGVLTLRARNDKDAVAIEVIDDGRGIDAQVIKRKVLEKGLASAEYLDILSEREIVQYIFAAGFSSKDEVTEVSGRGVGMDVVKRSIESIGGDIQIDTKVGKGTSFTLLLPASMAVKKVLLFEVGESRFAIPLLYIESVILMRKKSVRKAGKGLIGTYADITLSMIFLRDLFQMDKQEEDAYLFQNSFDALPDQAQFHVVLINIEGRTIGLVVDKLMQQKEIIEKPLKQPIGHTQFINGASILGDGNVCLILDVPAIVRQLFKKISS